MFYWLSRISNVLKNNKYERQINRTRVFQKPTDPYSHKDADTLERTARLLLGEEQVGRRGGKGGWG